jgi:peptidoglycan/xylan/chitin deacetylase (PgdA/CDA1 family)
MESLYDYGSRAGFWRLHRLFTAKKLPCTVFAVGMALERNPQACKAMMEANWEVASHGYRWLDYQNVDEDTEREHITRTIEIHKHLLGKRPVGMYQGKVRWLVAVLTKHACFYYYSEPHTKANRNSISLCSPMKIRASW